MRKFFRDFSTFIRRGNILDLAVGIIIGGAFNTIVRSLVNDIIMPIIGLIGGKNVANAKIVLIPAVTEANEIITPAVTLNYGSFIQSILDFFIVALSIFFALKVIKSIRTSLDRKKEKQEAAVKKPTSEDLLKEIRDLLKENNRKS